MNRATSLLFGLIGAGLLAWGFALAPTGPGQAMARFAAIFLGMSGLILVFVFAERK